MDNQDTLTPVQRGLQVLIPSDGLIFKTPQIQENVKAASDKAIANVSAKSTPINFYEDNQFNTEGNPTDGDNPLSGHRLAYNPEVAEDKGKSFDAWETYKDEAWLNDPKYGEGRQRKMASQRKALSELTGRDDITNDDVFAMGEVAKQKLAGFLQSEDGTNRVDVSGDSFQSKLDGDNRVLGKQYLNSRGEDVRHLMNTPELNARFFHKDNAQGRLAFEEGSKIARKGETVSDYDVKNTTSGFLLNASEELRGGFNNLGGDIVDLVATSAVALNEAADPNIGNTTISPKDKALFGSIKLKEQQARKEAQLAFDKQPSRESTIEDIKSVEDRTREILMERITLDEYKLMEGINNNPSSRLVESLNVKKTGPKSVIDTVLNRKPSTKDDKFKTLEKARTVRSDINTALSTEANKGTENILDSEATKQFKKDQRNDGKVSPISGAPIDSTKANKVLSNAADASVAKFKEEADKLNSEGKYVQAAAKWIQGGASRLVNNPGASINEALASIPHMASFIAAPTLAIGSSVNKSYTENTEKFFKEQGRYPNQEETTGIIVAATAKGLIQRFGAEVALGKPGKEAGEALTKLISTRLGVTTGMASTLATASVIEGGEEVLEGILDQVAVNQGTDKKLNSDELYKQFTAGMSAGGATRAAMQSAGLPKAFIQDVLSVGKRVTKGTGKILGSVVKIKPTPKQQNPEKIKENINKVVADVAKTTHTGVDEVRTPNIVTNSDVTPDFTNIDSVESTEISEETTQPSLNKAIETLGTLPENSFSTAEGSAKVVNSINSAKLALQNRIQAIEASGKAMTEDQADEISQAMQIIDHGSKLITQATKDIKEVPTISKPKSVGDIGTIISRGSAAIAEVDTTGLNSDLVTMVQELSEYDAQIRSVTSGERKTASEVDGDIYGSRINAQGKAGLGQHMATLGAAVSANDADNAMNSIKAIANLKQLQEAKYEAISKGYAEFQSTGKPVTVEYGNGSEFIVSDDRTAGMLTTIQKSIDILDKGNKLGIDLAQAHFAPNEYKSRKQEERQAQDLKDKQENLEATKVAPSSSVNTVLDAEADKRINTPNTSSETGVPNVTNNVSEVEGTDVETEVGINNPTGSTVNRTHKEIAREQQSVAQELITIDAAIKAAPSQVDKARLRAEKNSLIRQERELSIELNQAPKVPNTTEIKTPIPNSPEVEVKPKVDTQSEVQKNTLFSNEEINAALAGVNSKSGPVSKVIDSIITFSKNVKQQAAGRKATKAGRGDNSNVALLKPLKDMITTRKPEEKTNGLLSKTDDVFGTLREFSDDALTEGEWKAASGIESFVIELSDTIDRVLPEINGKNGLEKSRSKANTTIVHKRTADRSPIFQMLNEEGKLPPSVKDAMGIALLDWFQSSASTTLYQTPEDIYRFFGIDDKVGGLPEHILRILAGMGQHGAKEELLIGQNVLKMLNIKQQEDNKLDGNWETKLAQSIGQVVMVAAQNMTTSPTDGSPKESRGYLEFNTIPASTLTAMGDINIEGDLQESGDTEATVQFVKIPAILDERGNPLRREDGSIVLSKSLEELMTFTKGKDFKSVMRKLSGISRREGGITPTPNKKAPEYRTGTSSKLSPILKRFVEQLNGQRMEKNPQWELMRKLGTENKEEWLKMHGWIKPTITADGIVTFPELHDYEAISAAGKNAGLEREYDQMLQHESEYASAITEVEREISEISAEMLVRDLAGKPIGKLSRYLAKLEEELQGYKDGAIYMDHHVISTGRTSDRTSTLSMQRSKMHRNALSYSKNIETIDITSEKDKDAVVKALLEPMDLSEADFRDNGRQQFNRDIFNESTGVSPNPVIQAGLEAIINSQTDKDFDPKAITKAVLLLGESAHSLSGLMLLAQWSKAVKAGESTFESHGYTEVDGTTNGVIASMRQLVGGYKREDIGVEGSSTEGVRGLLNKGGMIFDGQTYLEEGIDYLKDNPDAYEDIGIKASTKLKPIELEVKDLDVNKLRNEVNLLWDIMRETKTGTQEHRDAEADLHKAQSKHGIKVFGETLPDFGLINGRVSSKVRKLMKAIVMPGGYQAGDAALSNALFNAWLSEQYSNMAKAKNEYDNSKTGPYIHDLNSLNDTLSKAGLDPVNIKEAKATLPPASVKRLRSIYTQSIGRDITVAYRDTIGEEYDVNAKAINSAIGIQGIIVADQLRKNYRNLELSKSGKLTNKERMDERKRAQEKDKLYVGGAQYGSTSSADASSIVVDEKVVIPKEFGGEVSTPFFPDVVKTNMWVVRDGELIKEPTTQSTKNTSVKENVPSNDIGVRGVINFIHGLDGTVQAISRGNSQDDSGNVYDAKTSKILTADQEAIGTNAAFEQTLRDWSMYDAVNNQLKHLLETYPESKWLPEMSEFFRPKEDGKEGGNRYAPNFVDENGTTHYFSGPDHFLSHFQNIVTEGNSQRDLVNNDVVSSAQHRIVGGTYEVKPHTKDVSSRGSSANRINAKDFDDSLRLRATPQRVNSLFTDFTGRNNIKDSKQHKDRLEELMNKHILPLVAKATDYTISVDRQSGQTGGLVEGKDIYIRSSDTAIRKFSTDMSDAEVLVHEFLHPIIEAGLSDNTKAIKELTALQEQAIRSDSFTPESLVDPTNPNQTEALKEAQKLYSYITGDIHEFMTFGLSNNVIRSALSKELIIPKNEPKNIVEKMIVLLKDLIKKLSGDLSVAQESTNIAESLDNMINSFDRTTQVKYANKVASVVNNKVVNSSRKLLADKVGKPLMVWGRTLSRSAPVHTGTDNSIKELGLIASKTPFKVFDTGFQKASAAAITAVTEHKQDFFSKMAREAMGARDAITRGYHNILSEVNEQVDTAALRKSKEIKKAVLSTFIRTLSQSEHKLIADTVLRGDLKALPNLNADIITNTDLVNNEITTRLNKLQSRDKQWINTQAKNLGSVMITGKPLIEDGNLNAFNIVTGVGRNNNGLSPKDEQLVDELKSLYAIKFMSPEQRNQLGELVLNESVGIRTVIEVDKVNHDNTLRLTYNNDKSRVVAGEVVAKSKNRFTTVILPNKDHEAHIAAGYRLVKRTGTSLSLYTRSDVPSEGYQKGVFSMGNAELEGTLVSSRDKRDGDLLLPVVSGGVIKGYRAVMDKETRESEAGMSIGFVESLGNHGARTLRLNKGGSYNTRITDMAYQDFIANGSDTKAFIKISVNSNNPQVAEFARLMPADMRKAVKEQWNGDMYLRKNQLDLLIGFRKASIVDTINQRRVANGDSEMNAALSGSIRLAGDVWQGTISEVKKRTVLFTPAVVVGNFTSNLFVSVLHGMNPVDMVRDQAEGLRAIRAYTRLQEDIASLDLQIELGNEVKRNTLERKRLQVVLESSGVHSMVQAGMFQTIVEDIDISGGEASPLSNVLEKTLPENIVNSISDTYMNSPDSVKKGIGVVMLSPSTKLGANIQAATAYSDFVARYAMMKHLTRNKGMSEAKARNEVMDIYVDYAPNTSKELQYINDSGLYMYTKFLLRIQRVIMRAMRKHPEAVIALEAAQQVMGNTSDIVDSSLLWGLSMSGGRSQNPVEAFETVTQLPAFYLYDGLKDIM